MTRSQVASIRILLLVLAIHLAGCAAPRQWTAAELDAVVNGGEVNSGTPLLDFELLGEVRQQGDKPGQRRFTYLDRSGSYTLGELQAKRTETEEERYQRLLGVFSDSFLRNGCTAPVVAIRDSAFEARPAHFKDPTTEAQPRLEDLALARASVNAIIAADLALASQHKQEAARLWSSAAFQEGRRNANGARIERDRSNKLLYVAAQIERNARILRQRVTGIDVSLERSRQRLRAQMDADVQALLQSPLSLSRKREYTVPFVYAADLADRFGPCGVAGLQDLKLQVFNRVTTELLFPLRQSFLRSTASADEVFTGNAELDAAFFGGQEIAVEMRRRAVAATERRQAEERKAAELRKAEELRIAAARDALRARRVKENLSPDTETVTEAWTREVANAAAADPAGTATIFLGMLGTVSYRSSGDGYCRISISAQDERDYRCTHRWTVSVSGLRCAREGSAHRCGFVATITPDGRGSPSTKAVSGLFSWRPDGSLDVRATSGLEYMIWGPRRGGGSSAGSSQQRSTGEVIREMQDFRCETGVDSKQVCSNR
jgi:hypothetical protein